MPAVLHYFDLPARAEATRVALTMAGVEFEDKRISHAEFLASPFKHLPVLQMDGKEYAQSTAMLRYAGRIGGFYPEDPVAALQVDEVVMLAEDCFIAVFGTLREPDLDKRAAASKALIEGQLKDLIKELAAKLADNPSSPFFVGESLTIADLQMLGMFTTFECGFMSAFPKTIITDIAPSLEGVRTAIMEHPKVKAYYASKA